MTPPAALLRALVCAALPAWALMCAWVALALARRRTRYVRLPRIPAPVWSHRGRGL